MSNIEYKEPAYTVIFIFVHPNGDDFSFINNVTKRFEFWPSRWGRWKKLLKPLTIHAFLAKSYNAKTSESGQGFTADEHIMEFNSIKEARIFNAHYLEQYKRWNDSASAQVATEETMKFVQKMMDFDDIRRAHVAALIAQTNNQFYDEEFLENLRWAHETVGLPMPRIFVDVDSILQLMEWDDFCGDGIE